MEARRYLQDIGSQVSADFIKNRSILSFEEYVALFFNDPRGQARNAAQYLHDVMDHYGTEQVPHPSGTIRRFKLFDVPSSDRDGRVAGQEEVQNAFYRLLGNFVRAGRINKLILLHGPNGSAKSTFVNALKAGMEDYSHQPQGALYRLGWVFPSEKLIKGSIGFGERVPTQDGDVNSYAHLESESIDVRMPCEMRDHPLFVIPPAERKKVLEAALKKKGLGSGDGTAGDFLLSDYIRE
ncbi:MAG TPA: serine protein kinase PrkA, partial [Myxococcaceae bacterium]